jgi:hypothetical protein
MPSQDAFPFDEAPGLPPPGCDSLGREGLAAARGILNGLLLGTLFWLATGAAAWSLARFVVWPD